ncbi:MAG TPA: ABC transporter permease [Saprospiraceae bacterium]|nr:ABC transporter permease [Saprospiraceae bacterium]HMP12246.1 ABC transporter permease [Saprospiraceae bacterium]
MNLAFRIARRYVFAKKTTNAINIITGISVFGIAVGAGALVLVLSVFNGFEDLITSMYSNFNPDVKVLPAQGKTFDVDSAFLKKVYAVSGVALVSQTLEETAFFEYKNSQDFGTLKGVDALYQSVTGIDSTVREGLFKLREGQQEMAVLGLGMRNKLQVNVDDLFSTMVVYMPKVREVGMFEQQFRRLSVYPAGTFVIQQEFNNKYVLTSIEFARRLLEADDAVSALEIKLRANANVDRTIQDIRQAFGADFVVQNRYEQEEAFLKLMKIEKWLSFAIVSLMLLLVAFNMVGALWMIVLEKQKDIAILKSMGTLDNTVRNIFLQAGGLLTALGIGIGFMLALTLYGAQKAFGLVSIPGNFIVDSYPISMRLPDFLVVAATVLLIGLLASVPPALRAQRVSALIREE